MKKITVGFLSGVLLLTGYSALGGQEMTNLPVGGALAVQSLKPYWHVFIAYAIVLVAVLGWVISMGRRLSALETRLGDSAEHQ
ncbi:MAG: hypothetical protein O2992_08465 [Gemmatimonadetes bacterium]|nr:hypothetical protein [Gemmatimonadota bacterium]